MSLGLGLSSNGGGAPRAQTINVNVANGTTGLLTTVSTFGLLASVTFDKTSGSSNLTINTSTGGISAAAGIGVGVTQSLVGTATGSDGVVIPFTANLTGAVVVPAAPNVVLTGSDSQLSIAWTDGSAGGGTISSHKIYFGTSSGGETLLASPTGVSPYVVTGLTNGTTYYVKVSAVNEVGEGALSTEQSAAPSANPYSALFNYTDGIYTFGDTGYASEALLLAAMGGSGGGGSKATIQGYVAPGSPNYTPNGDVHDGGTGWATSITAGGSGTAVGAAVSGEYQLTATSASRPWAFLTFPAQQGKGYRAKAKGRVLSGSIAPRIAVSNDTTSAVGLAGLGPSNILGTSFIEQTIYFSACAGYQLLQAGFLHNGNSISGVAAIDDLEVNECVPFNGWVDGIANVEIEATTGGSAPVTNAQVVWQADDGGSSNDRSYVRIVWETTTNMSVRVFAQTALGTSGVQQATLNFGNVAINTAFKVFLYCQAGFVVAAIDTGSGYATAISDDFVTMPGFTSVRHKGGAATTTNDFSGTIQRIKYFKEPTAPPGVTLQFFGVVGDSWPAAIGPEVGVKTGLTPISVAKGGLTVDAQWDLHDANSVLFDIPIYAQDGGANAEDVAAGSAASLARIAQSLALRTAPTVLLPPAKRTAQDAATNTYVDEMYTGMVALQATYPLLVVMDMDTFLWTYASGGDTIDYTPNSLLEGSGGAHLDANGRDKLEGTGDGAIEGSLCDLILDAMP